MASATVSQFLAWYLECQAGNGGVGAAARTEASARTAGGSSPTVLLTVQVSCQLLHFSCFFVSLSEALVMPMTLSGRGRTPLRVSLLWARLVFEEERRVRSSKALMAIVA